jgi:hypothetical protein
LKLKGRARLLSQSSVDLSIRPLEGRVDL